MDQWERIEQLVKKEGIPLCKLADIAGVVPSAVNKWKRGAQIRVDALARIAGHFGVPLDSLLSTRVVETATLAKEDRDDAYGTAESLRRENMELRQRLESSERREAELLAIIRNLTDSGQVRMTDQRGPPPAAPTVHDGGSRRHASTSDGRRAEA